MSNKLDRREKRAEMILDSTFKREEWRLQKAMRNKYLNIDEWEDIPQETHEMRRHKQPLK